MIAFLIVTSVLNLSLGFALALYLGRAQLRPVEIAVSRPPIEPALERSPQPAETEAPPAASEERRSEERHAVWSIEGAKPAAARADGAADAVETAKSTPPLDNNPPLSAAEAPEVEQDLLAGIEEFRNQLAKIKGHAIGTPPVASDRGSPLGVK